MRSLVEGEVCHMRAPNEHGMRPEDASAPCRIASNKGNVILAANTWVGFDNWRMEIFQMSSELQHSHWSTA